MRKLLAILGALLFIPAVFAINTDPTGIGIGFETEEFCPLIWLCDHRVVVDDPVEPGRAEEGYVCSNKDEFVDFDETICDAECCTRWNTDECAEWMGCYLLGDELVERHNNYAFEGEKIRWKVLVMDKNKIEEIEEVVGTIGSEQGSENDVEVECIELQGYGAEVGIMEECNARIDQEEITEFDDQIMAYYECTLTVETPDSMDGEYWVTVEASDGTCSATIDENEYWYFNPMVALFIDDDGAGIDFGTEPIRPGTVAYSKTILLGNDADPDSGVLLDMFISGTDFYDPDSSGARCVITNRLKLGDNYVAAGLTYGNNDCDIGFGDTDDHLCYYATNGAYSTQSPEDLRSDAEGYAPIVYGDAFTRDFYNDAEIIQANPMGDYWGANILPPGAEMAITFKLGLPLPCVGSFTDGDIYFWGEAI